MYFQSFLYSIRILILLFIFWYDKIVSIIENLTSQAIWANIIAVVIIVWLYAYVHYYYFYVWDTLKSKKDLKDKLDVYNSEKKQLITNPLDFELKETDENKYEWSKFLRKARDEVLWIISHYNESRIEWWIVVWINWEWGSWKTTFKNYLSSYLTKKEDYSVIEISIWDYLETNHFIKLVFEQILWKLNQNYFDLFLAKKLVNRAVLWKHDLKENYHEIENLKLEISRYLIDKDIKIVCFIDDLERGSADEIRSIVRLLKSLLDIPKLIIVPIYDKSRLLDSLSNFSQENKSDNSFDYWETFWNKVVTKEVQWKWILDYVLFDDLMSVYSKQIKKYSNSENLKYVLDFYNTNRDKFNQSIRDVLNYPDEELKHSMKLNEKDILENMDHLNDMVLDYLILYITYNDIWPDELDFDEFENYLNDKINSDVVNIYKKFDWISKLTFHLIRILNAVKHNILRSYITDTNYYLSYRDYNKVRNSIELKNKHLIDMCYYHSTMFMHNLISELISAWSTSWMKSHIISELKWRKVWNEFNILSMSYSSYYLDDI